MLGFRGHFSTKSRRYSTTLGCLRDARKGWRDQRTLGTHGIEPSTTVRRASGEEVADMVWGEETEDTTHVIRLGRIVRIPRHELQAVLGVSPAA